jgi:superfamily II DNA or RNA helicase
MATASLHDELCSWLKTYDFYHLSCEKSGCIFNRRKDDTCLVIDTVICTLSNYSYIAYTSRQNDLMDKHNRVFRFLFDPDTSIDDLKQDINIILNDESDPERIKRFGANRSEQQPDPTLPEATFEDCFFEAFGDKARMALHREFAYVDLNGTTRYIDYALFSENCKFAIELNGESFHHPAVIGAKKYRSQLFKQNSLIADGFKVYRWSLNGMRDQERFILELKRFMGSSRPFLDKKIFKLTRPVHTFKLHDHQNRSLDNLAGARKSGRRNFLLVLPTGTGKTEIFIEDIVRLKQQDSHLKALIIVPTRKLRHQTLSRLKLRLPIQFKNNTSTDILNPADADLFVQTTAYLHRYYYRIPADSFDYIVVDEAHHAAAHGLRNILEHFNPTHLLGVTATPERTDLQPLEKIFGEYEPELSLQEAIQQGLIPPVRCFRVKSNIDLSEVRFNGKEYVKNDLQSTLLVPSRDKLIAKVLNRYFSGNFAEKQGVVFCVDLKHAKRMTDELMANGISAAFVSGKDIKSSIKAQKAYDQGAIRFLCACDLLTEGWDAPHTSILVMARPTFSKVLYSQQLGRGLRNYKDKEALYVIDVVDNYGANLQPMSLHSLLKIPYYQPFGNLVKPVGQEQTVEITILDGLYEGERRIEPVNIFSFNDMYGSYLNEEQLARELFVSTGTVRSWLRNGTIAADVQYPFGRRNLNFFNPEKVEQIRKERGLKKHTEATRVTDFYDFLEKRDYTFSYKIIFILCFFKICNDRFEASLPDLLEVYQQFYQNILNRNGKNERDKSPYNRSDYLQDKKGLQRNMLANPFEKFERKRFFYHCRDLNYIAMAPELTDSLENKKRQKITDQMINDLKDYYANLQIDLSELDYSFLLPEKDQKQIHTYLKLTIFP